MIILIAVLFAAVVAFAAYKIRRESKADDIEDEISKFERKNRKPQNKSNGILITCDLCGKKYSPMVNGSCPECGARPHDSKSTSQSYTVNNSKPAAKYNYAPQKLPTSAGYNKSEPSFRTEEQKTQKTFDKSKLKPVIIIIAAIVVIAEVVSALSESSEVFDDFSSDDYFSYEDMFDADYELPAGYGDAGYTISKGGTVFTNGDIRIAVTGIYESLDNDGGTIIEYTMENNGATNVEIDIDCVAVNGNRSYESLLSFYEVIESGDSVSGYSAEFYPENGCVQELTFGNLKIRDNNEGILIYEESGEEDINLFSVTTDAYNENDALNFEDEPMFDKNGVKIYGGINDDSEYYLSIVNNSGNNFDVNLRTYSDENFNAESDYDEQNLVVLSGHNIETYLYNLNGEILTASGNEPIVKLIFYSLNDSEKNFEPDPLRFK